MQDQSALSGLLAFPNPVTQNNLIIDLKNRDFTADYIDILDLQGKLIIRKTMINQHFPVSMDVTTLHAGEYFLRITSQDGTFGRKFIKQ